MNSIMFGYYKSFSFFDITGKDFDYIPICLKGTVKYTEKQVLFFKSSKDHKIIVTIKLIYKP